MNAISYTGGYITKIKKRDSDSFVSMSAAAGGSGKNEGVVLLGGTWDFAKNAYLRIDEQYGADVFNTVYADGRLPIPLDDKTALTLGAQVTAQKSVGEERIGSFSTFMVGLQAAITHGPFGGQLYYTQTGTGFDTQNPFGDNASYLNLMQVPFNSAGEKAWGIGASVNFASLGAPGLTAAAVYAQGSDRISAATGAGLPDRNETDVRADYAFPRDTPLAGLVATVRYSWLRQDGELQTAPQLRVYLNYAVPF